MTDQLYVYTEPSATGGSARVTITRDQIIAWMKRVYESSDHACPPDDEAVAEFCVINYAAPVIEGRVTEDVYVRLSNLAVLREMDRLLGSLLIFEPDYVTSTQAIGDNIERLKRAMIQDGFQ